MREIVLDTETTGLDPATGDRIVEIGAVELFNGVPTGQNFHVYLNPERDVPEGAVRVHGLTADFLKDKPLFATVAEEFMAFIASDRLVIHNAEFDVRFLNAELARIAAPTIVMDRVLDTLTLARKRHPGAQNSLDALCNRYGVDSTRRKKHGALLDAELLAEVYLELNGGRQSAFTLTTVIEVVERSRTETLIFERAGALPARLGAGDLEAHRALVAALGDKAFWTKFTPSGDGA